jgi:hypothetical protein
MLHPTQRFVQSPARSLGLTAGKFNRLVLSVLGFAFSYVADTCISIIIYEFCLLPLETQVLTATDKTCQSVHLWSNRTTTLLLLLLLLLNYLQFHTLTVRRRRLDAFFFLA